METHAGRERDKRERENTERERDVGGGVCVGEIDGATLARIACSSATECEGVLVVTCREGG